MVQNLGLMNRILKIVRSAVPDTQVQLRPRAYGSDGIRHFLRDVVAMANASVEGRRYIITGVEIDEKGQKTVHGVSRDDFSGKPAYQSLVTDFIEPPVRVKYQHVSLGGKVVGVYEIGNCQDRPYMMRMDQSEKLRRGDAYIRREDTCTKMGRRQLQELFERKFRDAVSGDQIEIGFPGEIIHKDFRIPTVNLSKLPSALAGAKLNQLIDVQSQKRNTGSTTVIARLTHARLFGSDDPYEVRTPTELMDEIRQIERKHHIEDEHFLFERHGKPLQLVVLNQGDEAIEDASLTLVLPRHEAFYVANRLPRKMANGELVERGSAELADYPAVNIKDDLIHISTTLGDIPPQEPVKVYSTPVRICVGSALEGRKVGIRYSLFSRNLRKPAKGNLRLLF
jgi:schlafen family protein